MRCDPISHACDGMGQSGKCQQDVVADIELPWSTASLCAASVRSPPAHRPLSSPALRPMSVTPLALNVSGNAGDIALMAISPPMASSTSQPSTSLFSRLSMDPLQIVMHCCDTQSLLALARCSRSTLEAASYSFAWIHAPHVVVDMAHFDRGDPPLRRLWNRLRRRRVIGRPNDQPPWLPPPPPVDMYSTRPPALQAIGRVRWTCKAKDAGDWVRLRTAFRVLPTLPRLVALDMAHFRFRHMPWSLVASLVLSLHGLTALDISESNLSPFELCQLVLKLPQLRTLGCKPFITIGNCLQLLSRLPQLTDLGLVATNLIGIVDNFAVLDDCPRLRFLSLCDVQLDESFSVLRAPGLQSLQQLTLRQHIFHIAVGFQTDWAAIGANLQSLRCLTLEPVDSGLSAAILAAVAAGGFPSLAHLRVASDAISAIRMIRMSF